MNRECVACLKNEVELLKQLNDLQRQRIIKLESEAPREL